MGEANTGDLSVAVLTLSERVAAGVRADIGGDAIAEAVAKQGMRVTHRQVIADDRDVLARELQRLCDQGVVDAIFTTGGTGLSEKDITPEATLAVIEKRLPGMEWAMLQAGLQKTPHAMLSRSVVGTRRKTLIVNLPGSPKGAIENLQAIFPAIHHAIDVLQKKQVSDSAHQAN